MKQKTRGKRPYFLWDYDLTEADVRRILHGNNETERTWMMSRILTSARFRDVWRYVKMTDITSRFAKLKLRPGVKEAWRRALTAWGYHVSSS